MCSEESSSLADSMPVGVECEDRLFLVSEQPGQDVILAWTPQVCRIMALKAVIMGLWLVFHPKP